ncbi:CRISPR-associated endonuclease Csn1 [Flavobacterium akiainvivens]|nr:CRISPR-associated endonuclease Csn1 [Flavobacterium akiainvivens]
MSKNEVCRIYEIFFCSILTYFLKKYNHDIFKKSSTMKTILGLDLGVTSIGWAVIVTDDDNTPIKILGMGSRIIPLSTADKEEFQKGQAISKNQSRTIARTQRKGYNRKQLRKEELKKILGELGITPSKELLNLPSIELWKLRADAASGNAPLSAEQLGRIFYMLNQKRGYKSARSEANQDKKDTDYVAAVKGRHQQLKEKGQTIGQHFYTEMLTLEENSGHFQVKNNVYPREAYLEEFNAIIAAQKPQHAFLTDDVVDRLRDEVIFYQRKLKSQKGLVSICEFEGFERTFFDNVKQKDKTIFTGPKVAPKSSPLFQLCKIWETVNNINLKVKNTDGSKNKWADYVPTLEQKQEIIEHLFKNAGISLDALRKILGFNKDEIFVNKQIEKGLQGNTTYAEIHKILGDSKPELLGFNINIEPSKHSALLVDKRTGEILAEKEGQQVSAEIEKENFYQLWHTIYSIKDLDECAAALIKRFNIDPNVAAQLAKIDFSKGAFGNKSNKAMRKILPYLMQGYNYADACSLAGYNHSDSQTKKEKEENVVDDKLKLLEKNSLRQPVVEKIINQMIHVVNAIIDKYGKPDEIRVELARDLKKSKDERNEAELQNASNKKLNEEVANRLKELGLPVTKRFVQKYKFIFPVRDRKIKEAQLVNQCIYCGETFNVTEALSGDNFDVDHIIPKSMLFDDSQTNKVLVHRKCNAKDKSNKTAYDFIAAKGENELAIYLDRVDDWFKRGVLSYGKMQRLKVSYEQYAERKQLKKETEADIKLWENFIERDLRQTQYIAKKSKDLLKKICNNVTVTEGKITAQLRNLWGWDDVLMNLQLPKYKALGQTEIKEWTSEHGRRLHKKEEITNWTKRDDHRHHAIDALVVACTKQGFIQRINTLNSSDTKDAMDREIKAAKEKYNELYDKKLLTETNEQVKNHTERFNKLETYLKSQQPPLFTTRYVEQEADKIFVSFKAGKKAATYGIRKIKKDGKKVVVQEKIVVPRGALHEQSVYGKIKTQEKDKPLKYLFENPETIVDNRIKILVKERLDKFEGDVKKALTSLKKEPLFIDNEKNTLLEKAACYTDATVLKYKLQALKANQVNDIVDEGVKRIVKARLAQHKNEKEAFKDTVWFNQEKRIPIVSVRVFARPDASKLAIIKTDENNKPIGFALTGNNHHIAIYKDNTGKLVQHICTFWSAVERKKFGVPTVVKNTGTLWSELLHKDLPGTFLDKLPQDGLELEYSLQQNEMFVLGLPKESFEDAIKNNDLPLLSKHLYLVWSISDNDYWFRHHLETKNSELKSTTGAKESKRYYRFQSVGTFTKENPIKVQLNHLGEITKIGEP